MIRYIAVVVNNSKSLLHTNKYLRNKKLRERMLLQHAVASAHIEGVPNPWRIAQGLSKNGTRSRSAKRTTKRS
jgi:hypothetical protein